jgi:hypothetical protein
LVLFATRTGKNVGHTPRGFGADFPSNSGRSRLALRHLFTSSNHDALTKVGTRKYSTGVSSMGAQVDGVAMQVNKFYGEWNYELRPRRSWQHYAVHLR